MMENLRNQIEGMSDREKTLLLLLGIIVVAAGLFQFVLRPQFTAYTAACQELDTLKTQLAGMESKVKALPGLEATAKASQDEVEEMLTHINTDFQDGSVLVMLGMKCLEKEVLVAQVKPGGFTIAKPAASTPATVTTQPVLIAKDFYLEIPVGIELRGAYSRVLSVVAFLEQAPNLAEIRNLEISTYEEEDSSAVANPGLQPDMVTAKFDITFYSAKQPLETLEEELSMMVQWCTDRAQAPFMETELFSPLEEIPAGGETSLVPPPLEQLIGPLVDIIPEFNSSFAIQDPDGQARPEISTATPSLSDQAAASIPSSAASDSENAWESPASSNVGNAPG